MAMQATLQLKISLEKANHLRKRLEELKATSLSRRSKLEKEFKTTKDPERKVLIDAELALSREADLDISITNLLRASLDFAMEKFLTAPDITLIAALHASKATRGRPQRGGK